MKKKHRHKWELVFTDAGTCGRGLLYHCQCGNCLEYRHRKPRIKQLESVIWQLASYLKNQ